MYAWGIGSQGRMLTEICNNNIIRKNNDNDNSSDIKDNNPFKLVCLQSLLHNKRTMVIFKHNPQHTFRTSIEEKRSGQAIRTNKYCWCNKN